MTLITWLKNTITSLVGEEKAQDGFEYLLVVGGLSVGVVAAAILLVDGVPGIVADVQALIDGVLA